MNGGRRAPRITRQREYERDEAVRMLAPLTTEERRLDQLMREVYGHELPAKARHQEDR